MPKQYVSRPVIIEAIQWTGDNYSAIRDFCGIHPQGHGHCWYSMDDRNFVSTLEGEMEASRGDYIIRGLRGEFYPCKPDVFETKYEKL